VWAVSGGSWLFGQARSVPFSPPLACRQRQWHRLLLLPSRMPKTAKTSRVAAIDFIAIISIFSMQNADTVQNLTQITFYFNSDKLTFASSNEKYPRVFEAHQHDLSTTNRFF